MKKNRGERADDVQCHRSAVICASLLARHHEVGIDVDRLSGLIGLGNERVATADVVRALADLGLKVRLSRGGWRLFRRMSDPAIVELKDGRFAVVVRGEKGRALVVVPPGERAQHMTRRELRRIWTGRVITAKSSAPQRQRTEQRFGWRWFVGTFLKYRGVMRDVLVASFFVQVLALITPLIFMVVIDKVLAHNSLSTLDVLIFALVSVVVFEILLGGLRAHHLAHASNRVDLELGARLFRHMITLPLSYFESRRIGDTVARLRELETVRRFVTGAGLTLVIDLFFVTVFIAVMFLFSRFLATVVVAALPIFFLLSLVLTPILRGRMEDQYALGAENQAFLVETIGGIETVKACAAERRVGQDWEKRLDAFTEASFGGGSVANVTQQSIALISKLLTALLLWLAAREVMAGNLSVGQMIAFNMLAARVSAPVMRLAQMWKEMQQLRVSLRRLADILDAPTELVHRHDRLPLPRIEGAVRFDHVSFRYRADGPEVLSDASFAIEPGEIVGIVGPSGSGKTTLVKLLQRLYVPERGRVLLDGMDIARLDAAGIRRRIGFVGHDAILFNRSIRDNIALADPAENFGRVVESARLVGADAMIRALPDGYDTVVGERGLSLSAGQRQRLILARALLVDPSLLILDEATSCLDYESEQALQANLQTICNGRTVLIISHRLQALRPVSRVISLEDGRIVEDGAPETLKSGDGRFSRLHRLQVVSHEAV